MAIHESESKTLTCIAVGNPAPAVNDYKWIRPDGTITKSQHLVIRGAIKDDTGRYRCQVSVRSDVYGILVNGTSDTLVTVQCKYKISHTGRTVKTYPVWSTLINDCKLDNFILQICRYHEIQQKLCQKTVILTWIVRLKEYQEILPIDGHLEEISSLTGIYHLIMITS